MDVDDVPTIPQSSAGTNDTLEVFPQSPPREQPPAVDLSEEHSATERSFHSAREEITQKVISESTNNNVLPEAPPDVAGSTEPMQIEPDAVSDNIASEGPIEIDSIEKDLEEDLGVDASRSPSQGSSPARPLTRKSSLTFAPLPPREFTTKKSLGARASQTGYQDQSKGNLSRGSLLEQYTAGKSIGTSKQPESAHAKETSDDLDLDAGKRGLVREESDMDSKMTKLHNKSSTQRLHDKINMLGVVKPQPARSTKSIPFTATPAEAIYPELPKPEQPLQNTATSSSRAAPIQANEDEDDWIQLPQPDSKPTNRPQLPKSISTDVMEDIMDKRTIGGRDFGYGDVPEHGKRLPSPPRQYVVSQGNTNEVSRQKAASVSHSPRVNVPQDEGSKEVPDVSTTPVQSPSSRRYVDGPLSASKSKLQSIMKTARGLFSSSAGVSAQAKMETLSPSALQRHEEVLDPLTDATLNNKSSHQNSLQDPVPNPVGRKTRSSKEKGETRGSKAEMEQIEAHTKQGYEKTTRRQTDERAQPMEGTRQQGKPPRRSPRNTQNADAPMTQADVAEGDLQARSRGSLAQGQQHLQRLKEVRRLQKPAKGTASKPQPPPVAIKVALSQGMRMNNTLATNLPESLPQSQPKQPNVNKKPSHPALHPSSSNSSLKTTISATTKPKALIAAERKKEQVGVSRNQISCSGSNIVLGRKGSAA